MYATPTLLGSKSGALIASTWGSLVYIGSRHYAAIAKDIQKQVRRIVNIFGNNKNKNIKLLKIRCEYCGIFFQYIRYLQNSEMKNLDWELSVLTNPAAFHFCITSTHNERIITRFIVDLQSCITKVEKEPNKKLTRCVSDLWFISKNRKLHFT